MATLRFNAPETMPGRTGIAKEDEALAPDTVGSPDCGNVVEKESTLPKIPTIIWSIFWAMYKILGWFEGSHFQQEVHRSHQSSVRREQVVSSQGRSGGPLTIWATRAPCDWIPLKGCCLVNNSYMSWHKLCWWTWVRHKHTSIVIPKAQISPSGDISAPLRASGAIQDDPIQGTSMRFTNVKSKQRGDHIWKPKISEQGMAIIRYHNVRLAILIKLNSLTRWATYAFHVTVIDMMTMEIIQPTCNPLELKKMHGTIRNTFFDRSCIVNLPKGGDLHLCFGHIGTHFPCASTQKLLISWNQTEWQCRDGEQYFYDGASTRGGLHAALAAGMFISVIHINKGGGPQWLHHSLADRI